MVYRLCLIRTLPPRRARDRSHSAGTIILVHPITVKLLGARYASRYSRGPSRKPGSNRARSNTLNHPKSHLQLPFQRTMSPTHVDDRPKRTCGQASRGGGELRMVRLHCSDRILKSYLHIRQISPQPQKTRRVSFGQASPRTIRVRWR